MTDWVTLSKVLPQLVYPGNLMIWLLLLAFILLLCHRRLGAAVSLFSALIIIVIGSSPISHTLYQNHQEKYSPVPIQDSPFAEAIVMLSGEVEVPLPPRVESQIGGNRLLHTFRLYKAKKAPIIIISGGNAFPQGDLASEASYIEDILVEWGIPKSAILFEGKSRNTRENAVETAKFLQQEKINTILLVTSSIHMPRAIATFRSAGIDAIPSSSSIDIRPMQPGILDWLPSLSGLGKIQAVMHENLGIFVYRIRGWIR
ncbi:MAG: hypothetical protein CL402_04215 [Acidiferrobacteraceae bacterium]|jgi:uncharacterized SAM-binding protein YcdF (DUF218 family)|nr:hypothetical protein [Acidiferrobacteraceae bacterium]|tara:strand:+ start:1686 stop:2459 length:774 start_codon:yes stop_codon:yes gene_type:complete